jgi:1-phosphatidylinositol-4-phosphate 5-kinase
VKAYAPEIFSYTRWFDGLDIQDLMDSLAPKNNTRQIFKANKGQKHQTGGKSGSFFFFTEDRNLIIKTLPKHEFDKYLKILPEFIVHLQQNPNSLI